MRNPEPNRTSISFGRQLKFDPGAVIFAEGGAGTEMYVIVSGRVRIFIGTGERSITMARLKKGDFFGEMSLLEELPRSASAEAEDEVELVALSKKDFMFMIQQHPEIAMKILGKFSSRLRDANRLIELLLLGDHTGMIIHKLVTMGLLQFGYNGKMPNEWFLPITSEQFATECGIPLEQVRTVLKELDRIGLATVGPDGIIIRKHRKLKSYLEYLNWKLQT